MITPLAHVADSPDDFQFISEADAPAFDLQPVSPWRVLAGRWPTGVELAPLSPAPELTGVAVKDEYGDMVLVGLLDAQGRLDFAPGQDAVAERSLRAGIRRLGWRWGLDDNGHWIGGWVTFGPAQAPFSDWRTVKAFDRASGAVALARALALAADLHGRAS